MEGGFRLYSEADIERVEAEEIKGQIQAGWRTATGANERREKIQHAQNLTQKQRAMIGQKLEQLQEMRRDLDAKLERYRGLLAQLDCEAGAASAAAES